MIEPREAVERIEAEARLPIGDEEARFAGYAVLGLPFRSGHMLALRRFPASSVGPAYRSVWHRDPAGRWTMYNDVEPHVACNRGFGAAVAATEQMPIAIDWPEPRRCVVSVGHGVLRWEMRLAPTRATRLWNGTAGLVPTGLWKRRAVLSAIGAVAGPLLGVRRVRLHGRTPNGQRFTARPRRIWMIPEGTATLRGEDLGPLGPLPEQIRLGDLWLPQRGLFAAAESFFESTESTRLSIVGADE